MTTKFTIYIILIFIISIYGVLNYRKLDKAHRWLTLYTVFVFLFESINRIYNAFYETTFPGYHFFIPCGILFNAFIYVQLRKFSKKIIIIMLGMSIGFTLSSIINSIFYQPPFENVIPSNGIILHGFLMIFFSLLVFLNMLKYPSPVSLKNQSVFWISLGNLFFYGLTFCIFGLYNFYFDTQISPWAHWMIWSGNVFMYSCYLRGIYLNKSGNASTSNPS